MQVLDEFDNKEDNTLLGYMKSGIQNDCENVVYNDKLMFNRETQKIYFL